MIKNAPKHYSYSCILLVVLSVALASTELPDPTAGINADYLTKIEKKYGKKPTQRLIDWKALIEHNHAKTIPEKLKLVNDFFNDEHRILYGADSYVWYSNDYWATPTEFLVKGAGDCEDYSIAKYFTLRSLGVPDEQLQITYVRVQVYQNGANQDLAHMVLGYFDKPNSIPLILDNIRKDLAPANERTDIVPVYSFNGARLWVAKQQNLGHYSQDSSKIKRWADLNKRFVDDIAG